MHYSSRIIVLFICIKFAFIFRVTVHVTDVDSFNRFNEAKNYNQKIDIGGEGNVIPFFCLSWVEMTVY